MKVKYITGVYFEIFNYIILFITQRIAIQIYFAVINSSIGEDINMHGNFADE